MSDIINVAFIGNPNCGKTTLFNAYTGAKLKVANWPGVTVEKKEGVFKYHSHEYKLVDLPGIYSLTSYTMEEKLSRQYILEDEVDVIIDVMDASSLERNLYLALSLIELGKPVVLALNMMDIVEERGMAIDFHRLPEMLGVPAIPVSARNRKGLDILIHAAAHHAGRGIDNNLEHHHEEKTRHKDNHHKDFVVVYSDEIEDKIDILEERLSNRTDIVNKRWHAIKLLERDEEIMQICGIDIDDVVDRNYEADIINQKYDFIEEVIEECLVNKESKAQVTDKVDRFLTHRILGLPIFLMIMALVFFFTFTVGDAIKVYFEYGIEAFSNMVLELLTMMHTNEVLTSLIVDGIIAGVGGILTFLPNIFILFLALAILEDSGYMARVAYVMDGVMGKLGLSGRAFIPMLLGFGCTVPAVMASRALEDRRDRLKTILITPFMSCSARLPIYVLFSQIFFGDFALIAAYSMYVLGLVFGIAVALVIHIFEKGKTESMLLIELPEYKRPNVRTIFIYVEEKVKDYIQKAGTTIFIASIVIWVLLNFGPSGMVVDMSESFGAIIGKVISPILKPAGLSHWQIVVALISGIAAKEIVVSSMGILFGISNASSAQGMQSLMSVFATIGFTRANAYALMVFCLIYVPCAAAIGTIKKETGSIKITALQVIFQLVAAYIMATLTYGICTLIGW